MIDSSIRAQFPVCEKVLFLNHAGVSPVSLRVADAIRAHIQDVRDYASVHSKRWGIMCSDTRKAFATLIKVPESEVAIMKNTTEPINVIATGFPWNKGDNIILTNAEYPANVYPWLNQQSKDIEIRYIKERNGKIEINDIKSKIDDRTRIVSISFVEFASGYRNDMETLGKICQEQNVALIVDAIQGLGAIELDAQKCNIDALTTGMHKWLLGPCGVGLFYCKKSLMDILKLEYVGADGVVDAENYLDYNLELLPDAKRFEYAMLNYPGIAGSLAAFDLIQEIGIPDIQIRLKYLTEFLCEKLWEKGYSIYSPRGEKEWSGIVSCQSMKYKSEDIFQLLKEQKVYINVRAGRLRIAPHYYNNEEDILKLIHILPSH